MSCRGERIPATPIDIAPYLDDPARHRFEALATMRYQFVLCPQVPGGVFRLSSRWPAAEPDGAPRVEEVLTLLPDEGLARP